MKKKQKRGPSKKTLELREKRNASPVGASIMKALLFITFCVLVYLFYSEQSVQLIMSIMFGSLAIGGAYFLFNKELILTSKKGDAVGRFIIAYAMTVVVVFFYALAMWRSDQLHTFARNMICGASFFVFYAFDTALRGVLHKKIEPSPEAVAKYEEEQKEKNN